MITQIHRLNSEWKIIFKVKLKPGALFKVCHWDGDEGTMEEDFVFYDGKLQHRTWKIKRLSDSSYRATADDIIGIAKAKRKGNAIQWNYQMDIKVDARTYRISFDDWMWQLHDGVVINRSYMKKFGFTVGELTVFLQKTIAGR